MSEKFTRLKSLLLSLLKLDQPDLDFGLYRVIAVRSAEIRRYLDHDLPTQVRRAFAMFGGDGPQPPGEGADVSRLEAEVYDHLTTFLTRYWQDGDFLARRVYKQNVYALPYEGEEVKLHWANREQYYVKTTDYLRDYTFVLNPDRARPLRVHFRLVEAAPDAGNYKAAAERAFLLAEGDFIGLDQGELVLRFEYRKPTMGDWPAAVRDEQKKPPGQADLIALAVGRVRDDRRDGLRPFLSALLAPEPTAANRERSLLERHLHRYTARNSFDYFIHKDLRRFLRRELDFFIKNEIMYLDDIELAEAPKVEQYLAKLKVLRAIAHKLIDFFAQMEEYQKRLWLKRKFVVESSYCLTLDRIPPDLYPALAASAAQREQWVRLYAIDELPGCTEPLTATFLAANPYLMADLSLFPADLQDRVLERLGDLDAQTDGLLINSENFQALRLLQQKYYGRVDCLYLDPPYNAATSAILYRNEYKHSSWLSFMADRLEQARLLLHEQASLVVAIDENEQERLGLLLSELYPEREKTCVSVVHNPRGIQGGNFSYSHEYAYFVFPSGGSYIKARPVPPADWEYSSLRNWGGESERQYGRKLFYPLYVRDGAIVRIGEAPPDGFHPEAQCRALPGGEFEVWPIDRSGVERKWRYSRDSLTQILGTAPAALRVISEASEVKVEIARLYEKPKTVWHDPRYDAATWGTRLLGEMVDGEFSFPKSVHLVQDCVGAVVLDQPEAVIMDFFGGSGTTAHAVINLNRSDQGRRKYVLVETNDYFDRVIKPRVMKAAYATDWSRHKPANRSTGVSHMFKVLRLETYEDTLDNLELRRTPAQESLLAQQAEVREPYLIHYLLNMESRGSPSLLNLGGFADPNAYRLKVRRPGSEESRTVTVDLVETFNFLLGLTLERVTAPRRYAAECRRDDAGRLVVAAPLQEAAGGPWWFRTVSGLLPDGRRALIIWRNLTGEPERDNLVLEEWVTRQGLLGQEAAWDVVWVNGDSRLGALARSDSPFTVRLTEADFHRLMWDSQEP